MASSASKPPAAVKRASYRSGFFYGGLSFAVVACLGVVSTIATARAYGVTIVGQFAIVSVPVAALWVLSSVKEQQALIREIANLPPGHPRVGQLFAVVFTFSAALTLGMGLLVAAVCPLLFSGPLHAPALIGPTLASIAGYAIVTNTGWNIDSILSAFLAGRQIFWVRLHEVLSFVVIAVAVGQVWHSVWGLVIATIGASLTSLIHRVLAVRRFVRARISWQEYRSGFEVLPSLLSFGVRAAPGQIAQGVSQQGGVWALGMVAPVAVVGAFSRAQTIPQRLQQATMRISEVLYPTLVGRHSKGDAEGFDRALIDSIRYEVVGLLAIAAMIGGSAHAVLSVFGPGFGRASAVLAMLMVFPALASVTVTQTQALWATSKPGRTSLFAFARLLVTLSLLVTLTPPLGMIGPAIALLAGYCVGILLSGLALRDSLARPSRVTWPLRERASLAIAYTTGFAASNATEHALGSIAALPLCLAVGALAYAAAFLLSGGLNLRDRRRLSEALELARVWRRRRAGSGVTPLDQPRVEAPEPSSSYRDAADALP